MIYCHLGAGAGDLDQSSNFRCGFTEFVKKNYKIGDKIFAIEANPANINKLKDCYKDFAGAEIFNLGISQKNNNELNFFYTDDDAPHFQVCSTSARHVKKHYPNSKIKSFKIKSISINNFLEKYICNNDIDYLSIDLEGIDYEILMSINLKKYNIHNISVEYLHLNKNQKRNIVNYLIKYGYSYCGYGYDHNNFDYLFKKKTITLNIVLSKLLWVIEKKHLNLLNFFLKK